MPKKHSEMVKKQFEGEHTTYDKEVREVLPHYDEMHHAVINVIDLDENKKLEILDLGTGTGQTASELLRRFPKSRLTGIDLSPKMLGGAKKRLKELAKRARFIEADIIDLKPSQKFDICVAVLSVHHLNQEEKQGLFKKI
ncbi:MAG: class I SAM-dependent methyltransferase, partial [Nanoarchaeota archaeon]|nr:class I SAM-dependent methyltransferase [Nanoarchaeota archaeon]